MNPTLEIVARPPDGEDIRNEFNRFISIAREAGCQRLSIMFGFAWGNDVYDDDWLEEDLSPSEVETRVMEAEGAGFGAVADDDLFVTVPETGLKYTFCHENDIHVEGDPDGQFIHEERSRFLAMNWIIHERTNTDGRHGKWNKIENKAEMATPRKPSE